jgi:hypothetical protein
VHRRSHAVAIQPFTDVIAHSVLNDEQVEHMAVVWIDGW